MILPSRAQPYNFRRYEIASVFYNCKKTDAISYGRKLYSCVCYENHLGRIICDFLRCCQDWR